MFNSQMSIFWNVKTTVTANGSVIRVGKWEYGKENIPYRGLTTEFGNGSGALHIGKNCNIFNRLEKYFTLIASTKEVIHKLSTHKNNLFYSNLRNKSHILPYILFLCPFHALNQLSVHCSARNTLTSPMWLLFLRLLDNIKKWLNSKFHHNLDLTLHLRVYCY